MYPNPVHSGSVVLHSDRGISSVDVINLAGQVVAAEVNLGGNVTMSLDMGDRPQGVYMVKTVHADGHISTGRLVVQH